MKGILIFSTCSKHGLVVSGHNQMFMAGGEYPDGSASKSVWRFDPLINVWQEMASMQTPRSELGLSLLDGHIYAVGGWEGSSRLDSVERYEIDSNTWTPIANMKLGRVSLLSLPCHTKRRGLPSCTTPNGVRLISRGNRIEQLK